METKRCSACKEEKLSADYHKCKSKHDGLHDRCKACRKLEHLANREANIAKAVAWNREHKERHKEIHKRSTLKHREKRLAYGRDYMRQRWATDAEHRALRNKYAQEHPEHRWLAHIQRRARRWGCKVFTATYADWLDVLQAHAFTCHYCKTDEKKLTIDHKVPFSRGGEHTKDNIVPACGPCNSSKRNLTDVEFFDVRERRARGKLARAACIAAGLSLADVYPLKPAA
jgi:hypothetical protein